MYLYTLRKLLKFFIFWIVIVLFITFYYPQILKFIFPFPYREIVYENSEKYHLDPLLVIAIIKVESGFNPHACSSKGAMGLMQLMPETGAWVAQKQGQKFSRGNLKKPEYNISYGCWYLEYLQQRFANKIPLMLSAYNSGHLKVHNWVEEKIWDGETDHLEAIPFSETRVYVRKVLITYGWYKKIYGSSS